MASEHVSTDITLFFMLYGMTGVVPLLAALYLLLRRGNAIAPGVTPPMPLRRWTAAFFAVVALAHVWWFLFYSFSTELQSVGYVVLVMVDCVLLFVTFAGMLLAMLQDRRRPMWPASVALIPFVALGGAFMAFPSSLLEHILAAYLVLLGLLFTAYMVMAIRQYGQWLNDNYADLENKKVWLCQAVALVSMLMFVTYALATEMVFIWLMHIIEFVLVGLLLWRVETMPNLESHPQSLPHSEEEDAVEAVYIDLDKMEQLLVEHCVDTQLYLQHDLNLHQLAQTIGTNRSYLSQYFSRQGITYNTYINNLRINHFVKLYEAATKKQEPFTIRQLSIESGYCSYSTFSLAFKQRTGQSVTTWTHQTAE